MIRCGLCEREVKDWKIHEQSEEHQNNLKNPKKIKEAFEGHKKYLTIMNDSDIEEAKKKVDVVLEKLQTPENLTEEEIKKMTKDMRELRKKLKKMRD